MFLMKNSQKGSANVVLVTIIIILVIAVGYFAFFDKPIAVQQDIVTNSETQSQTNSTVPVDSAKPATPVTKNRPSDSTSQGLAITSVSPTSVSVGTSVTIKGRGFSIPNPVTRAGMSSIPTGVVVNMQDAKGQNIPVFTLQQGVTHSDDVITFTVPSQICKYNERGCGDADPASYYWHILPGVYKLSVQIPNTDYFSDSINITVR